MTFLSLNYLYFFKNTKSQTPHYYWYIKDAELEENPPNKTYPFEFELRNVKKGINIRLAAVNEKRINKWITKLKG